MAYLFRLRGKGFRHFWEKECSLHDALIHASQVAGECANDVTYEGASVCVIDSAGKEVAVVPVSGSRPAGLKVRPR